MGPGELFDILASGLQGILLVYFFWRLRIKVYARLTSWGMYTILLLGFLFIALPRSYQISELTDYQHLIRLIIFVISGVLCAADLKIYLGMTKEQKEERYPKEKYVRREDYDLLIKQLELLDPKMEERRNK